MGLSSHLQERQSGNSRVAWIQKSMSYAILDFNSNGKHQTTTDTNPCGSTFITTLPHTDPAFSNMFKVTHCMHFRACCVRCCP